MKLGEEAPKLSDKASVKKVGGGKAKSTKPLSQILQEPGTTQKTVKPSPKVKPKEMNGNIRPIQ